MKKTIVYHDAESNQSNDDSSQSSGDESTSQCDSIEREMNTITLGAVEWTTDLEKHLPTNTTKKGR